MLELERVKEDQIKWNTPKNIFYPENVQAKLMQTHMVYDDTMMQRKKEEINAIFCCFSALLWSLGPTLEFFVFSVTIELAGWHFVWCLVIFSK